MEGGIICLQEFKLELISNGVMHSLGWCQHLDWCYSASRVASGRSLLMWDRRVVEKVKECLREFTVACFYCNVENGFPFALAGVYGRNSN